MAKTLQFKTKKELDARAQVEQFIQFCRDELTEWAEHIQWDDVVWDITQSTPLTGRKHRNLINWTQFSETKGKGVCNSYKPMTQPFGNFARAFIRYYRVTKGCNSIKGWLIPLRVLEKALMDRSTDGEVIIERIDANILDRCADVIRDRYSSRSHYDLGNCLIQINCFLVKNGMLNNPCDWANPFSFFNKHSIGTDQEIIVNRHRKLLSEAAYDALLEINAKNERGDLSPKDQVVSSLCMVCCAAPERSAEITTMRHNLMVEGHAIGNKTRLFLAWYPVKGGDPQLKPVPDAWEEVTRKAIARLQRLSVPAREMAFWYEKYPEKIYLPPGYEYLREREWLTIHETGTLLGLTAGGLCKKYRTPKKNVMKEAVRREPDFKNWDGRGMIPFRYNFADLERHILSQLPRSFPFVDPGTGLKYSELLNIYPYGLFKKRRTGPSLVMFEWFDYNRFLINIGSKDHDNIFSRNGYFEDEANSKPLGINTHSFRHMMVTMGQDAGMSDLEMAEFRGSQVVEQNEVYKHKTSKERMAILGMDPEKGLVGRDDGGLQMVPITEEEIQALMKRGLQLHANEYGLCAHPIEQEPCPRFLACLGCTEQLCKVGDAGKTKNVEREVQRAKDCLANAEKIKLEDNEDGYEYSDADPWIKTHKATVEDGEALLEILRDPNIPQGTWVKRTGPNRYDPYIDMVAARAELTGAEEDLTGC